MTENNARQPNVTPRYQKQENIIYARFGGDGLQVSSAEPKKGRKSKRSTSNWLEAIVSEHMDNQKFQRARSLLRARKIIKFEPEPFCASFLVQGTQLEPFELIITFVRSDNQELTPAQAAAYMEDKPVPTHWSCTCPDMGEMCSHVGASLFYLHEKLELDPEIAAILLDKHTTEQVAIPTQADFWKGSALPDIPPLKLKNSLLHGDPKLLSAVLKNLTDSAVESLTLRNELEEMYRRLIDLA
ncbi:MAG: hypothetical protein Q3962_00050 [Corynebacterium sp.]|nr:hypothetical protein [Corynebacterium sp.]